MDVPDRCSGMKRSESCPTWRELITLMTRRGIVPGLILIRCLCLAAQELPTGHPRISIPREDPQDVIAGEQALIEFHKRLPVDNFVPRQVRTDKDADHAHSLALFGQGRSLFQQQRFEDALAAYQRAWLWNPAAASILWEIVPLAFHLERYDLAVRYAILANERLPRDAEMMQQLAMILAQEGEVERANKLLRSAIASATRIA